MEKLIDNEDLLIDMAELFKVFADSTRVKILSCLLDHNMHVAELTEKLGATQPAISHQLRILKQAKLVKGQRQGKQIVYRLADNHVATILGMAKEHLEEEKMKKSYELANLDCAHCAAKMEAAINKLPNVEKATVSFMTSRLAIQVAEGTDLSAVLEQAQKEISKVDSDCKIVLK